MNSHNSVLHILGEGIAAGESREINFHVAKLHSRTRVEVPVIINRSKKPGPVVLFVAGIHGDEVNGVEIVRQLIAKGINKLEDVTFKTFKTFARGIEELKR